MRLTFFMYIVFINMLPILSYRNTKILKAAILKMVDQKNLWPRLCYQDPKIYQETKFRWNRPTLTFSTNFASKTRNQEVDRQNYFFVIFRSQDSSNNFYASDFWYRSRFLRRSGNKGKQGWGDNSVTKNRFLSGPYSSLFQEVLIMYAKFGEVWSSRFFTKCGRKRIIIIIIIRDIGKKHYFGTVLAAILKMVDQIQCFLVPNCRSLNYL